MVVELSENQVRKIRAFMDVALKQHGLSVLHDVVDIHNALETVENSNNTKPKKSHKE